MWEVLAECMLEVLELSNRPKHLLKTAEDDVWEKTQRIIHWARARATVLEGHTVEHMRMLIQFLVDLGAKRKVLKGKVIEVLAILLGNAAWLEASRLPPLVFQMQLLDLFATNESRYRNLVDEHSAWIEAAAARKLIEPEIWASPVFQIVVEKAKIMLEQQQQDEADQMKKSAHTRPRNALRAELQWMWADVDLVVRMANRMRMKYPPHWSEVSPPDQLAESLEKYQHSERPILLRKGFLAGRTRKFTNPQIAASWLREGGEIQWMWADVGIPGCRFMAELNPIRWSGKCSPKKLAEVLKWYQATERPVFLRGSSGHSHRFANPRAAAAWLMLAA